ncbi:MAG TPA: type II secretion system protein [Pirellulales bacterium]|jgi:prepilin-type N-terminal cleavage/methylation domain-containing protein|nr:type II secretion system protein [Pirellulales bacterium]
MKKRRFGFTLVELIVVVAILSLLAALVLPRVGTLMKSAGHAAGASSMADTTTLIQAWNTANGNYPDGWDTRLGSSGQLLTASTGITPTAGSTAVLPTELVGATGRLATYTLSAGDVQGFNNVGITTVYNMDTAPPTELTRPDDWFNTQVPLATGTTVAVINAAQATVAGTGTTNKIIDHIYRSNLTNGGKLGTIGGTGNTDTIELVAFGLGAHNTMVAGNNGNNLTSGLMVEAPVDGSFNSAQIYNRLIVVFAVDSSKTPSTVTFAGVFGADGDLVTDDAAAINNAVQ